MPDNNIKSELAKLIKLQNIDSEIYDLESQREIFPKKIQEMDDLLETKTTGINEAEERLKHLQVSKNEKETEMQSKEEKIQKHEGELFQIKNNKEYTALKQEIESIGADVSLLEENIIELFDEIEAAKKHLEEERNLFDGEKEKIDKEKKEIVSQEKVIIDSINELSSKRDEIVKDVDPQLLERYERIKANKGRSALSFIDGDCCSGCNMHLRPQIINEVKILHDIVYCESCARILYDKELFS